MRAQSRQTIDSLFRFSFCRNRHPKISRRRQFVCADDPER
jgi:hypothetical protein